MKKLLLSLAFLIGLGLHINAADIVDKLTTANFTGISYTASKTYKSPQSNATYKAQAASNKGFQIRDSKKGTGITVTNAPEGYTISSITVTISHEGSNVNAYFGSTAIDLGNLPTTANESNNKTITYSNINEPYFALAPGGDAYIVISEVTVTWTPAIDPNKTYVKLTWDPAEANINIGDEFTPPTLNCSVDDAAVDDAKAAVVYTFGGDDLLTFDDNGKLALKSNSAGKATVTATIPADNEEYVAKAATYTLIVKDPNAITVELTPEFFNYKKGAYGAASGTDEYGISYSTVYFYNNGMQYNTNNSNGKGSGISVTSNNTDYIIKSIEIDKETSTVGLNVYSLDGEFAALAKGTNPTIPADAQKVNSTVITESTSIDINATAFAILPDDKGVIVVNKVIVTYIKKTPSELSFSDKTYSVVAGTEDLSDAPVLDNPLGIEVVYTSSDENVAIIDSATGEILIGDSGTTTITAAPADAAHYVGTASYTLTVKPAVPTITIDGVEVTNFDENYNLNEQAKDVTITAAEGTHIYHKFAVSTSAPAVEMLAETTADGFTHVEGNTTTLTVSENGTLEFYAEDPATGTRSDIRSLTFNGAAAGISEIEASGSEAARWYDLQGRRVAAPAKGNVYIIKQGSKTSKRAL